MRAGKRPRDKPQDTRMGIHSADGRNRIISKSKRGRAKAQKGVSVRVGDAGGPNKKGEVTQEAHDAVVNSLKAPPDAINDVALPRDQRENAGEYFEMLRKGE